MFNGLVFSKCSIGKTSHSDIWVRNGSSSSMKTVNAALMCLISHFFYGVQTRKGLLRTICRQDVICGLKELLIKVLLRLVHWNKVREHLEKGYSCESA